MSRNKIKTSKAIKNNMKMSFLCKMVYSQNLDAFTPPLMVLKTMKLDKPKNKYLTMHAFS